MASKKKQQNLFKGAEGKLAAYEAKQAEGQARIARRSRDNRIAIIAGIAALLIAGISQVSYSLVHPSPKSTGAVTAAPSESASATPSSSSSPASASPSASTNPLVPNPAIAQNRLWNGTMQVNNATLGIQLFGNKAPQATANFISLVNKGFYKGVTCHRLTTSGIYVLQCGDPRGDGTGGPGYSFGPIENVPAANAQGIATYKTGYLAMANAGTPDSNGSQFFIVYKDSPLSPAYTVFGQITSGLSGLNPIIKAGVADGSGDGKPAVPTTLGAIKLN